MGAANVSNMWKQRWFLSDAAAIKPIKPGRIGFDVVVQGSKRFMSFAEIEETRVRSDPKRLFLQSKKIQIQGPFSMPSSLSVTDICAQEAFYKVAINLRPL
jgi:hypothetical protein